MQSAALGMLFMVLSSCSSRQGSELESCAETSQLKQLFGIRFCELFFVVNLNRLARNSCASSDRQNALFLIMV